jgi:hypothetical protein
MKRLRRLPKFLPRWPAEPAAGHQNPREQGVRGAVLKRKADSPRLGTRVRFRPEDTAGGCRAQPDWRRRRLGSGRGGLAPTLNAAGRLRVMDDHALPTSILRTPSGAAPAGRSCRQLTHHPAHLGQELIQPHIITVPAETMADRPSRSLSRQPPGEPAGAISA